MATELDTLKIRLSEAEAALHRLLTGASVVMLRDQNGETAQYSAASRSGLVNYIASLKSQIAALTGCVQPSGPMRVWM